MIFLELKKAIDLEKYNEYSEFVTTKLNEIFKELIATGQNQIILNTNLKAGLPMENINKIAGPIMEAWAQEKLLDIVGNDDDTIKKIIECARLDMADTKMVVAAPDGVLVNVDVDVKATAIDIASSGKGPNITSFARIRNRYLIDPKYMFIILSLRHRMYSKVDDETNMVDGIMEVLDCHAYDIKFLSESDISYNPSLGTGQIQIRDINNVQKVFRTTNEFIEILDAKFIRSKKGIPGFEILAEDNGWYI